MDCDTAREALSARLDGEADAVSPDALEAHLADCATCRAWYEQAASLNRLLRVSVATEQPDITDIVLSKVVLPRRGRWRLPLKAALIMVAIAQLTIGVSSLFTPVGMPTSMAVSQHMDHESAAFNLAFGVILLLVGFNTRRAATQVPVLASFVLVLGVASVFDLADGAVDWARLATHLPVVLGLILTAALSRQPQAQPGPGRTATTASRTTRVLSRSRAWPGNPPRHGSPDGRADRPPAARRDAA